ncbi:MAG: esterase-like activity of phytase family protein, partial [Polymorphobacter sp.]
MTISKFAAALLLGAAALPAHAAISFTGFLTVAGNASDLSGLTPSGANTDRLSFGSDLVYNKATDTFYGMTDRGPGGGLEAFQPRVEAFKVTFGAGNAPVGFALQQTVLFSNAAGQPLSGLNPLLLNGNVSTLGNSFDSEGLVRMKNGHYLVSDEYGPSVYEFDATGKQVRAFTTPANLIPLTGTGTVDYVNGRPTIQTGRQDNRGFEGLTLSNDGTKAYAIMQDPLVQEGLNPPSNTNAQGRYSRNLRIVEFDVASGTQNAQYIYQLEDIATINAGLTTPFAANQQGRSIGASSITMMPDGTLLVIERDNRGLGVDDPNGAAQIGTKKVFRIDLTGATDVKNISLAGTNSLGAVVPVSKALYLDVLATLGMSGLFPVEKLEGLAFGPRTATGGIMMLIVSDNDFSVTQTGVFGNQSDVCTSGQGGVSSQVAINGVC